MTMNRARFALLAIFLVCLVVQTSGLFLFAKLWEDRSTAFVLELLKIYSVHLAVILSGIFAVPGESNARAPRAAASAAIFVAVFWNVLLAGPTLSLVFRGGSDQELLKYLTAVSSSNSFLWLELFRFSSREALLRSRTKSGRTCVRAGRRL